MKNTSNEKLKKSHENFEKQLEKSTVAELRNTTMLHNS